MIALAVAIKAISLICQSGYALRDSPSAECQTEQHPFCDYSFRRIVFCFAQVETPYTCSSIVFKLLMLRSETNVPVLRMSVHVLYRDGSSYQTWRKQRIHVISCIYISWSGWSHRPRRECRVWDYLHTEELQPLRPAVAPLPLHKRGLGFCNEPYKRQRVVRENNAAVFYHLLSTMQDFWPAAFSIFSLCCSCKKKRVS